MDIKDLLVQRIEWQQTGEEKWLLHADVQSQRVRLRLNDFPEENLCTVFIGNRDTSSKICQTGGRCPHIDRHSISDYGGESQPAHPADHLLSAFDVHRYSDFYN